MSLSQKIVAAVDELSRGNASPASVAVREGNCSLAVAVSQAGVVGVECHGLEFQDTSRPDRSFDELQTWGASLAAKLTYLMEPFSTHEADPVECVILLRSASPSIRQGQRAYYEIRLDRTGVLRFNRWSFDEAAKSRRPAPCQLTIEVLERLTDDFVASAALPAPEPRHNA